jgi:hypothetical protein
MDPETLVEKIRRLPLDKRQAVEHFVESIEQDAVKGPRRSLMGALAHLNIHVTEEDIDEARREMWGNFPRTDI